MRDYLFNFEKIKYLKGEKPRIDCILCGIRDGDERVVNLEVHRSGGFIVSLNLYPFNPGHLMIFPSRHVEDFCDLTQDESSMLSELTVAAIKIIRKEFQPAGFNIGFNMGKNSGASISHLHQHIVPRYPNELGFMDIVSGSRVFVIDPKEVKERLIAGFKGFVNI